MIKQTLLSLLVAFWISSCWVVYGNPQAKELIFLSRDQFFRVIEQEADIQELRTHVASDLSVDRVCDCFVKRGNVLSDEVTPEFKDHVRAHLLREFDSFVEQAGRAKELFAPIDFDH